jgi:very-short-patch-repair endonuclease
MTGADLRVESEAPEIAEDFFQGDVVAGLTKMRKRLLDLTARNRLLNYRYGKKSSLRVVDEFPDQLFTRLIDGKEFLFRPVPNPRRRVRELETGDQVRADKPPVKDHAESLGIATSFELPTSSTGQPAAHHTDKEIQTLHYPEELEAILRSLSASARSAIEETGTNMLFLVFGYLEWYESEDSNDTRLAPLILLPVTVTRQDADDQTRTFKYVIRYSGEEIVENVSLQERLRQDFKLDLPSLDEDSTPETYFRQLRPLLRYDERWKIRRNVTLTLLSFGKMLMYRDLDPTNWPRGAGPQSHPRVKELFQGIQSDGITFAEDYNLDDDSVAPHVPEVIDEADSSQHSALVDVLSGRNVVIAGPPGTGKSQTITNLIAATLARGKSVLFVSEKLAALEVVRHRLDRAGLGTFCLELHSHKAQKRQLLDDISARIQKYHKFRDPSALDQKLQEIKDHRNKLTAYADLINRPFGRGAETLWQIIWTAQRRRRAVQGSVDLIESIVLPAVAESEVAQRNEMRLEMDHFVKHLGNVASAERALVAHPWFGVSNTALTFLEDKALLHQLGDSNASLTAVEELITRLTNFVGDRWLPEDLQGIERVQRAISMLPRPEPSIAFVLLPKLSSRSFRARLEEFLAALKHYLQCLAEVIRLAGKVPGIRSDDIPGVSATFASIGGIAKNLVDVANLSDAAWKFTDTAQLIQQARTICTQIWTEIGCEFPFCEAALDDTIDVLRSVTDAPIDCLIYRHSALRDPQVNLVLHEAAKDKAAITELRTSLEQQIDLELIPGRADVRRFAVATSDTSWWKIFTADYRAAKKALRVMSRSERKFNTSGLRATWRRILDLVEKETRFLANEDYAAASGPFERGLKTPLSEMIQVAEWYQRSLTTLVARTVKRDILVNNLWEASTETLRALSAIQPEGVAPSVLVQACKAARHDVQIYRIAEPLTSHDDLTKLELECRATAGELQTIYTGLLRAGFAPGFRLADGPRVLALMLEMVSAASIVDNSREVQAVLEKGFRGVGTEIPPLVAAIDFADRIGSSLAPNSVKKWLLNVDAQHRSEALQAWAGQLATTVKNALAAWASFRELGQVVENEWLRGISSFEAANIQVLLERGKSGLGQPEELVSWLDYVRARETVKRHGLQALVDLAETQEIETDNLLACFDFILANSIVQEAFAAHRELARFTGLSHEEVRNKFAQLDLESIELYRGRAAALIDQRPVPSGNGSGPVGTFSEVNLLVHEIGKQKRHVPVRQLVRRAGRALQALKPCFMMGPLSVAQYLAPGYMKFDLVVMDEASQLRPEDAIGAIARGAQLVVVGDQQQLPPTSFFDRLGDDQEDESEVSQETISDSESILDVATVLYRPARMLRWHYRSRHGSLIAFSNKEFYKSQLVVFPSPVSKSAELGVKLVRVKNGVYAGRKNVIEAHRVVDAVIKHMCQRSNESLGVVTLNSPQRELIEELFEQRLKSDPLAEEYVSSQKSLTPFFIKNLENVQGDERDVIYISSTFGPDAAGHVFQRFGPINGIQGHRRLNVLFTRAKKRVVLFTSMSSSDIQTSATSTRGLKALKGYLHYAETGILDQASFSGREPDSDFEIEVAEALREQGLEVVAQVGIAGYFIDLAVKHPSKPDAFILGVECDGATYHSSLSARDRDRLREAVLKDLGWNIHRIWSTDWFKDPAREIDRLQRRLMVELENEAVGGVPADLGFDEIMSDGEPLIVEPAFLDGEEEDQALTKAEARAELTALRHRIEVARGSTNPKTALLRDHLLELLLSRKPITREEWLRKIPFDDRFETDMDEVEQYLSDVLAILAKLA